jgi:hypothetical protein
LLRRLLVGPFEQTGQLIGGSLRAGGTRPNQCGFDFPEGKPEKRGEHGHDQGRDDQGQPQPERLVRGQT